MCVAVQGEADAGVAQPLTHDLRIDARQQHRRCRRVAQIVKTDRCQPGTPELFVFESAQPHHLISPTGNRRFILPMPGAGEVYASITVDPAIVHGRPVIARTRVPVAVVLHQIASGQSIESVCASYDLTSEQVRAAIGYGASLVTDDEIFVISPH